ncbi:MAG: hypothetical protein ACTSW1_12060 [Candidatus Hodarchaeales archaeon]
MSLHIKLEPRTERVGLFSLEEPLTMAIKEINNPDLSMKRSTRGFTALYKNKPMNPILAGKSKKIVDKLLHQIFAQYVKHLTIRVLQKFNFELQEETEQDEEYVYSFVSSGLLNKVNISVSKENWLIVMDIKEALDDDFSKSINVLANSIGRKVD